MSRSSKVLRAHLGPSPWFYVPGLCLTLAPVHSLPRLHSSSHHWPLRKLYPLDTTSTSWPMWHSTWVSLPPIKAPSSSCFGGIRLRAKSLEPPVGRLLQLCHTALSFGALTFQSRTSCGASAAFLQNQRHFGLGFELESPGEDPSPL